MSDLRAALGSPDPPRLWPLLAAVFVGGALGALSRSALSVVAQGAPWMTLIENTLGAFLLASLLGFSLRRRLPPWALAGLGTGALGSFTSMSAFVGDAAGLAQSPAWAVTYVLATLVFGLLAGHAGLRWSLPLEDRMLERAISAPQEET